jgi:hypothetical protein
MESTKQAEETTKQAEETTKQAEAVARQSEEITKQVVAKESTKQAEIACLSPEGLERAMVARINAESTLRAHVILSVHQATKETESGHYVLRQQASRAAKEALAPPA